MKHIFLTYLLLATLGAVSADAQSKKVYDDIYYTADDAKKDAEAAEKERQAIEEARRQRAAEREANGDNTGYESGEEEYIDYDDDDYYYANRFNRFSGPYYGASYWAYDPFYWDPWWGGGYYARGWGWGPSWGFSVGYGGPYWSSYWGWNNWCGYPGFYSAWNSPWYYGYGYGGGYYNGFYDGYYAGAYGGGINNIRTVSYGPRSSINRYPGSLRATNSPRGGGQLRRSTGEMPAAGSSRGYSRSRSGISEPSGASPVERRGSATSERMNPSSAPARSDRYNSGVTNRQQSAPSGSWRNSGDRGTYNRNQGEPAQAAPPSRSYQQAEPARSTPSRSYQRSEPSYQRSAPANSAPSRSYSSPGSIAFAR